MKNGGVLRFLCQPFHHAEAVQVGMAQHKIQRHKGKRFIRIEEEVDGFLWSKNRNDLKLAGQFAGDEPMPTGSVIQHQGQGKRWHTGRVQKLWSKIQQIGEIVEVGKNNLKTGDTG